MQNFKKTKEDELRKLEEDINIHLDFFNHMKTKSLYIDQPTVQNLIKEKERCLKNEISNLRTQTKLMKTAKEL